MTVERPLVQLSVSGKREKGPEEQLLSLYVFVFDFEHFNCLSSFFQFRT